MKLYENGNKKKNKNRNRNRNKNEKSRLILVVWPNERDIKQFNNINTAVSCFLIILIIKKLL